MFIQKTRICLHSLAIFITHKCSIHLKKNLNIKQWLLQAILSVEFFCSQVLYAITHCVILDNILVFSVFLFSILTSHWSIKEADWAQLKPTITYYNFLLPIWFFFFFFLRWIKIWNVQYLTMQRNFLTVVEH